MRYEKVKELCNEAGFDLERHNDGIFQYRTNIQSGDPRHNGIAPMSSHRNLKDVLDYLAEVKIEVCDHDVIKKTGGEKWSSVLSTSLQVCGWMRRDFLTDQGAVVGE